METPIFFHFLLLFALFSQFSCYKILIFVPNLANSQVQFTSRVAETLANGGHDVTMLFVNHFSDVEVEVKIPKGVRQRNLNAFVEGASKRKTEKAHAELIFQENSLFDPKLFQMMKNFTSILREGCRLAIRDQEFRKWLIDEKFDVAFTNIYSTCTVGFVHLAKIPWIWLNSGPMIDHVAYSTGVPIFPSYVPPLMMASTDTMNFYERTKSFIGHTLTYFMSRYLVTAQETQIFRDELNDPSFPHTLDIGARCPLVMVNTNPIYDLPRPQLSKVVNIGGLGVGFENAKPLVGEFKKLAEKSRGVVVFSFGSVAAAHEMPLEWKNSILDAFSQFPDYEFLMRYVADDIKDRLPKNVHTFKWLPQKDLLLHNNTKAFITHGGYNSMQEAISAGIPLVTIALFGDQPKNAKIAEKHGFAVNVDKGTFSSATLSAALGKVLSDSSYSTKVKRLSAMVRHQPIKSEELLLKYTEFLAEFKTLENLQPAGIDLNFFQYYSLDVIVFLSSIIFISLFLIYKIVRVIFCSLCCSKNREKVKVN